MNIPKYVIELLGMAEYTYDFNQANPNCAAGYTIRIHKYGHYQKINTLLAEVERLCKWVERNNSECHIITAPTRTQHSDQYITVTIFDPIMKHIEKYIGVEIDRRKKARAARRSYGFA